MEELVGQLKERDNSISQVKALQTDMSNAVKKIKVSIKDASLLPSVRFRCKRGLKYHR